MAKKSSGKHYQSKGERPIVSRNLLKQIRADRSIGWKMANITKHWAKGENPWVTIDNPNKEQTNMRRIKVRTNEVWGPPRPAQIKMRNA